jgi:hypothetical protein
MPRAEFETKLAEFERALYRAAIVIGANHKN